MQGGVVQRQRHQGGGVMGGSVPQKVEALASTQPRQSRGTGRKIDRKSGLTPGPPRKRLNRHPEGAVTHRQRIESRVRCRVGALSRGSEDPGDGREEADPGRCRTVLQRGQQGPGAIDLHRDRGLEVLSVKPVEDTIVKCRGREIHLVPPGRKFNASAHCVRVGGVAGDRLNGDVGELVAQFGDTGRVSALAAGDDDAGGATGRSPAGHLEPDRPAA